MCLPVLCSSPGTLALLKMRRVFPPSAREPLTWEPFLPLPILARNGRPLWWLGQCSAAEGGPDKKLEMTQEKNKLCLKLFVKPSRCSAIASYYNYCGYGVAKSKQYYLLYEIIYAMVLGIAIARKNLLWTKCVCPDTGCVV